MKKVMIFGTFDILHKGHLDYILKAKKQAEKLICVVSRDLTTKIVKKIENKFNEKVRLFNLKNLNLIDKVVLGNLKDKYKVIEKFKPDVLVFGYDQKSFNLNIKEELKNRNLKNVKIINLKSGLKEQKYKSSKFDTIKGKVVLGEGRGRLIGFRTANLDYSKGFFINGVYGVRVEIKGIKKKYFGLLNIGVRPTFKNNKKLIYEVHILDFNKEIYGEEIKIELLCFLRIEKKFDNMNEIKNQIKKDEKKLRKFLNKK